MATEPVYATRERVQSVVEFSDDTSAVVDRAIAAASRSIDADTHRRFYPETATRYFDWPPPITSRSWRLWLDQHSLISVASMTIAGTGQTVADFNLEPVNDGPPYHSIEVDLSTSATFTASTTHQQQIAVTGEWGWNAEQTPAGTLAATITNTTATTTTVTNGGLIGTGDLITIDSERLYVSDVGYVDTTVDTDDTMDDDVGDTTLPTADESDSLVGETVRVDDEHMLVTGTDTGVLYVKRAQNGTRLASHASGADIYANRSLTIERGATGSTAATHFAATAVTRQAWPQLLEQWCIAEAVVQLAQTSAAYARTAGTGDNQRETAGTGLADIREQGLRAYGRRVRTAAI